MPNEQQKFKPTMVKKRTLRYNEEGGTDVFKNLKRIDWSLWPTRI